MTHDWDQLRPPPYARYVCRACGHKSRHRLTHSKYACPPPPKPPKAERENTARHRIVVVSRDAGLTLEEIGLGLGISRERVRQIEIRARRRLRALAAP